MVARNLPFLHTDGFYCSVLFPPHFPSILLFFRFHPIFHDAKFGSFLQQLYWLQQFPHLLCSFHTLRLPRYLLRG
jgi:hypothetical protein